MTNELDDFVERTVRVPASLDRQIAALEAQLGSDADWSTAAVTCMSAGLCVVGPDQPVRRSDLISAINSLPKWTDTNQH